MQPENNGRLKFAVVAMERWVVLGTEACGTNTPSSIKQPKRVLRLGYQFVLKARCRSFILPVKNNCTVRRTCKMAVKVKCVRNLILVYKVGLFNSFLLIIIFRLQHRKERDSDVTHRYLTHRL